MPLPEFIGEINAISAIHRDEVAPVAADINNDVSTLQSAIINSEIELDEAIARAFASIDIGYPGRDIRQKAQRALSGADEATEQYRAAARGGNDRQLGGAVRASQLTSRDCEQLVTETNRFGERISAFRHELTDLIHSRLGELAAGAAAVSDKAAATQEQSLHTVETAHAYIAGITGGTE